MGYELTKSRYCKGLQCPKILWMDQHHPELGEDVASQSVLDNGGKVGELARSYFGEYELVTFNVNKAEMADKTSVHSAIQHVPHPPASVLRPGLYFAAIQQ